MTISNFASSFDYPFVKLRTKGDERRAILVTGGAGYIAAPSVLLLLQEGYRVVVIDKKPAEQCSLLNYFGTDQLVYVQADYANTKIIQEICENYNVIACMHFAAYIEVGESVADPRRYYENNVTKAITLINTLLDSNVKRFIFSSSCAVYGAPQWLPLTEEHPRKPISPYGNTKLAVELVLEDYAQAYNLQYGILRYFNAAGGIPTYNLYEQHEPETHLMPRLLNALREHKLFTIYGHDYETPDGTCVRDYVHIADLAQAHLKTLDYLLKNSNSIACNIGTGTGFSVAELITMAEQITGKKLNTQTARRRAGDPALLVANPEKAIHHLQWQPQFSSLRHIIESAYARFIDEADIQNKNSSSSTRSGERTELKG
jgi:UDP-glucose 4-epimerase